MNYFSNTLWPSVRYLQNLYNICMSNWKYSVAYLGFHFGGGGSKFFWKSGDICMALSAMQRVAKPRVC